MYEAQTIHRQNFDPNKVQISTILSIKTGNCTENCSYCAQSSRHNADVKSEPLMNIKDVLNSAMRAKAAGATRFCMGAAWRQPSNSNLDLICEMITEIKKLGLETCVTLGLLKADQAERLKNAGLDFYNHNIDTSEEFYGKVVTTRTLQDRLDTIELVRKAGIKLCCGGILGMGETNDDRIKMLVLLASFKQPPESIPINKLIRMPGTPLENSPDVDSFDFVRTIAVARIMFPQSYIRLSAGREQMNDEMQALCFIAGANSIFYGEKLLTATNILSDKDNLLFKRLGLEKLT